MFSFGGAQRFPRDKKPYCAELYYDAMVARGSKTPAFGHGQRFGTHMLINNDAPSPQRYNVPSTDFGDTKKGFIFGISREKYDKVYIKEHLR